ncbi:hypothetical protein Nepgr_011369 [Nepenthes gracilis]|uniref:Scarecrow-like protein 6 n=1 Tax=Nepenthes gracilis TaxID=150966 RepID=A0AAD3SE25_NEPGR|nr:hypothetical protein Nepgr_011369 [Nepenthes gracilis]
MMTAMPYNLQGKGVVDVSGISQISSKWRNIAGGTKLTARTTTNSIDSGPTSILDTRRSPSPPTSTSTLSSFNGGGSGGRSSAGGGGTENKDEVAALFDNTHIKCPISLPESTSESPRKEDWAVKLQNLHNGSDIVRGCCSVAAGCGCGSASAGDGLGIGDFENIFPGGDGALLPWIIGETDDLDLGLKHLLQSGNPSEYEATGIGVFEQSSGMGGILAEGVSCEGSLVASMNSNLGFPGSGFNHYGKIDSMPPSCSSGILHCKQGNGNNGLNHIPQINLFTHLPSNLQIPVSLQTGVVLQQQQQFHVSDEKPQTFSPQMLMNQQQAQSIQNPSFLLPPSGYCQLEQHLSQPQAKRHNLGAALDGSIVQVSKSPFPDQGHEFLLRKHQQQQQFPVALAPQSVVTHHLQQKTMVSNKKVVSMGNEIAHQHYQLQQHQHLQEQAVRDHLFKAADLIQTGNFSHAQEILARLNHLLSLPAKPLMRAALYVKEALQLLLLLSNPVAVPQPKCLSPFDVVHKMNAYKAFSEVSPFMQFVNFTCTQAILEALDDADAIHIVDFDIGCGAKWASFMQELPLRKRGTPSLKITAFASASTNHPFELALMRDNLTQFANDIGIAFDLQVVNLDSFDPSNPTTPSFLTLENESIAVSFPIWASSTRPHVIPSLLRFIKHQSPKIMVSLDRGCDRCDIPFTQHILHALDSCTNLLESLDSLSIASEVVNKVEKFFVQPTIESSIVGRLHAPDKIPHWKNLFASAGFSPLAFSNFTETQADYVVKRTPGKGFHVDKRQASLVLSWQRRELVAASAWRC